MLQSLTIDWGEPERAPPSQVNERSSLSRTSCRAKISSLIVKVFTLFGAHAPSNVHHVTNNRQKNGSIIILLYTTTINYSVVLALLLYRALALNKFGAHARDSKRVAKKYR